ncbi:cytochrome c oxidase subunit II [Pseudoroseicyclus aestuarii]|uniref:Cytochrome c oxidase subunit 2 n=1 Tax=Pseudoroseicyclus aestuarii TaxID=1795041 RepID=A0A318SYQ3_9RHOB|nr:cytochrome c oxidase subunit II [Pseudoroseicyclus aestuarii]PYE85559.1 cytochrome c oxidase subunit 2 [Pseudoroseicyclus aestuarii]
MARLTALLLPLLLLLAGCSGRQSALGPGGADAQVLAVLFFVMLGGAVVLWLFMNGLFYWATRRSPSAHSEKGSFLLIVIGGILFPTVVLAALLSYGLAILPDQRAPGDGLTVAVRGEQWWWRVEYWPEGAEAPIRTANEIRLPVGARTEFRLDSHRVIHSFWVPALGGKMDMFPGRETRMSLEPVRPGLYRGQCAEFCGESHAWMAFEVEAMEPAAFDAWLAHEASDARPPEGAEAQRGAALFAAQGCGACHAVRGTEAVGQVGPDLTHVGSRHSLGAGRLGMAQEDLMRWIRDPAAFKPGAEMPAYDHLSEAQLSDLATYLRGLQ